MLDPRMALIEKKYAKDTDTSPEFRSGDTVKVHVKVKEGNRERIQIFEGVVIGRQHGGIRPPLAHGLAEHGNDGVPLALFSEAAKLVNQHAQGAV